MVAHDLEMPAPAEGLLGRVKNMPGSADKLREIALAEDPRRELADLPLPEAC
jgi:hypothetical protein